MPANLATAAERNTRAFLWFRVLFNSRFYYPIYTILFLDFGLSLEQFALLNLVWAASIVVFEVPSGALADRLGRRRLVVFSAFLMVVEMLLLCLMPVNGGHLTFSLFLANRVISGLAEACCSGADESLVYDSLPESGRHDAWTRVLASLMRWQSLTFMLVALTGAVLYDADPAGGPWDLRPAWLTSLSKEAHMRLPLWANLAMAVATVVVSLRFTDTHVPAASASPKSSFLSVLAGSFRQMANAARFILQTPAALVLILTGMLYDGFMRLFYTVGSNYYRLLGIPESCNGLILAGSSLIGIGTAMVVEKLVGRLQPSQNLGLVAAFIFTGLTGIALQITAWHGWAGILFVVPFWLGMRSLHYFLSQYLHRVTSSDHRATVLSFKGLSMNLAYGAAMWLYGSQTAWLRHQHAAELAPLSKEATDVRLLSLAMPAWPWAFALCTLALTLWVRFRFRRSLTALLATDRPSHN